MKNYLSIVILACLSITLQAQTSTGKHHIKYLEINTGNSDYGVDFLNEKVVFAAATSSKVSNNSKYQPHLDLFVGDVGNGGEIINKTRNKGIVTKSITKTGATFTKDGKTVYFSAKKYSKRKSKKPAKSQLFKASIDSLGNWVNVEKLPINNKKYSIEHPSLNKEETKLYFSSDLPTTLGGKDIFVSTLNEDGTLGNPKNLGDKINTVKDEITPFVADNNFMYFSSNGHDGIGNFDIYATETFDNTVSDPLHLDSPINSINDDFAYIVNSEKSKGYFSSNRLQGQDNNDIYSFYIEPDKPKECLQQIVGTVRDKETENLITDATIVIFDEEGKEIETLKTDEKGNYRFELGCRNTYTVAATKEEYSKEEHIINTASYFDSPPLEINQGLTKELKKVTEEKVVININPIYFGFDKSYIQNEAKIELDRIVEVMQENPDLIIESASHTDSRGSKAYNQKLSERRAKATVDYIVSKGINRSRITAKGYGESQLINNCESGIPCSKYLHQLNRRTEFVVINKQSYYKSKEPPSKEESKVVSEVVTDEESKFSEQHVIKKINNITPVIENVPETTILNTSIVVVDNQEDKQISSIENKKEIQDVVDSNVNNQEQALKTEIINSYQTNQPTNNIQNNGKEASTDASSTFNETTIEKNVKTSSINTNSNTDQAITAISEKPTKLNDLNTTTKENNTNSVDLTVTNLVTDNNIKESSVVKSKPINNIREIKKKPLTANDLKENNTIANFNEDLTNKKDNISSVSNTLFNDEDDLYAVSSENATNSNLSASIATPVNTIERKNYDNAKDYKVAQFKKQYILSTKNIKKEEVLALNSIEVSPISIKNNGKYVVTSNAKKVDVMRINFQISNNENITPGHKEVYILIQNPHGIILNRKGKFKVLNGNELTYTEKTNAYYDNHSLNISMVTDRFIQKIIKGLYTITIYVEGYPVGLDMVELS